MKIKIKSALKSLLAISLSVTFLLTCVQPVFAAENEEDGEEVFSSIALFTGEWQEGVYEVDTIWYNDEHPGGYWPDKYFGVSPDGQVFILPQGAEKIEEGKGGTENFLSGYIGDYALLSGGIVIDKSGKTVFDVDDTDYDKIYSGECLDVGYVICSKDVNTFSDTSTHYYKVNVKDGKSTEIICNEEKGSGDWDKMFGKDKGKYYLSNGYYVAWGYKKDDVVYSAFYDLLNNKTFIAAPSKTSVHKDQKTINFNYDQPWYGDGKYFYSFARYDGTSLICQRLDLKAGTVSEIILDKKRIAINDKTKYASLGHGLVDIKDNDGHIMMYDMSNDKLYDTSKFYKDIEIVEVREDRSILMKVRNEGGGRFLALMDAKKGDLAFDPVPYNDERYEFQYSDSGILTVEDYKTYHLYDWKGKEIKKFTLEKYDNDYNYEYRLAGDIVFLFHSTDYYNPVEAYSISAGKEIEIDYKDVVSDISGENSYLQLLDYNDGVYLFRFYGYNVGTQDAFLLGNEDLSKWTRVGYSDFEKAADSAK